MGIVFDFDGVLANTLGLIMEFSRQACVDLGYQCDPRPEDVDALDTMEFDDLGRQLGIPEHLATHFTQRILHYLAEREGPLPIYEGIAPVVHQISTKYSLGIVTGSSQAVVETFLDHHQLKKCFNHVLALETRETKAQRLMRIAPLLNSSVEKLHFVGDAKSDVRAAREAGARSVAVAWGNQSLPKLLEEAPDFVACRPQDLLELFAIVSPRA